MSQVEIWWSFGDNCERHYWIFIITIELFGIYLNLYKSTMRKPNKYQGPRGPQPNQNNKQQRPNFGGEFLFNKTSLLSSALQKLKGNTKSSAPKRVNEEPIPLPNQEPSKKVKVNS